MNVSPDMQIDGAGKEQVDSYADRFSPPPIIVETERDYGPWLIPRNRSSRSRGQGRGGALTSATERIALWEKRTLVPLSPHRLMTLALLIPLSSSPQSSSLLLLTRWILMVAIS